MSARARAAQDEAVDRKLSALSGVVRFATVTRGAPLTVTTDGEDAAGIRTALLRGVTRPAPGDVALYVLVQGQPVVIGAVDDFPPDPATEA